MRKVSQVWLLVFVIGLLTAGCGVDAPATSPTPLPAHGTPSKIELNATSGIGPNGGHATVTARVLDAYSLLLPDVAVTFGATAGTLSAATVATGSNGVATTTLTADPGTVKITAVAGGVSAPETQITIQPLNVFVPPPPGPPPPPEPPLPPTPPPPPLLPFYLVAVAASPTSVVTGTPTTLTATVTPFNAAPPVSSATWLWDCDTATPATDGATPNSAPCTYTTAGTFTARVTVTGSGGTPTGTATTTVTVTAAPPIPILVGITPVPVAATLSTIHVGNLVDFVATVSSTAALPATLNWEWDDDNNGTFETVPTPAPTPTNTRRVAMLIAGIWKVNVRVTDAATGRTATTTSQVTVLP